MAETKHLYVVGWKSFEDDRTRAGNADIVLPSPWGRGTTQAIQAYLCDLNGLEQISITMIFYAGEIDAALDEE